MADPGGGTSSGHVRREYDNVQVSSPLPSASTLHSLLPGPSTSTNRSIHSTKATEGGVPTTTSPRKVHHVTRKRADLISLKQRLAQLLSPYPELGELYWSGMTEFVLGKITRPELGEILEKCFLSSPLSSSSAAAAAADGSTSGRKPFEEKVQAINLHNALLLSILYNTTRPTLPSSSIRHVGFNPRGTKKRNLLALLGQAPGGGGGGGGGGVASAAGNGEDESEQREGGEMTRLDEHRTKKIKQVVMRVGKRERAEIKANANMIVKREDGSFGVGELAANPPSQESVGQASRASRGGQGEVTQSGIPKGYQDNLDQKGVTMPKNFTQEYNRLVQAPLCCESRSLPDADTLRDRMMLIAYEEGMVDGLEGSPAANLLSNAMDYYVKQIISSAVSLVRGPAHEPHPLPLSDTTRASASTFAPARVDASTISDRVQPLPSEAHSPDSAPASTSSPNPRRKRPLAITDFHALFANQPGLLGTNGSTHTSAVERMYALPPQSDSEDESDDEDTGDPRKEGVTGDIAARDSTGDVNMSLDDPPSNAAPPPALPPVVSGKMPRLSTASRNRTLSFYGAARPVPPVAAKSTSSTHETPGRTKFLLDPTSLHGVPEGHPDVPHVSSTSVIPPLAVAVSANEAILPSDPLTSTATLTGVPATTNTGASNSQTLSPKSLSLRNSLFPELANPPISNAGSSTPGAGGSALASMSTNANSALGGGGGVNGHGGGDGDSKNGNGTTTDEADSEFDDLTDKIAGNLKGARKNSASSSAVAAGAGAGAKNSTQATGGGPGGLKIKLGGTTTGTVTPTTTTPSNAATPPMRGVATGGTGASGAPKSAGEKDKEMGRKLWEVVDSVRLLDGVLDP